MTQNKIPYFTWTKKWGWRINGYIKETENVRQNTIQNRKRS